MTLVLFFVMIVFFVLGYKIHKKLYQEKENELENSLKEFKEEQQYFSKIKIAALKKERELNKQAAVLQANFNDRWKEVETRIQENDALKNQIFILKRNCTCGGINGTK